MRAAVYQGPGEFRIEELPDPEPARHGVVIAVEACGVCGSDLKTWRSGRLVRPGQVLGHEFAGRIVSVGSDVDDLVVGEYVTALPYTPCGECPRCREGRTSLCDTALLRSIANGEPGAFAEYLHIPHARRDSTVFALPDDLPAGSGALVEPLAVGVHAVNLAEPGVDAVAVVLGLGTVGLSVVHALAAAGVRSIIATDLSAGRREAAARVGARVVDPLSEDLVAVIREHTGPGAYRAPAACDVVFDCAGAHGLIDTVMPSLRAGGTLVLAALHDRPLPVDATSVVRRGVRIVGTFGYDGDFGTAARMVASGEVVTDGLVSHRFDLERITEAFETQADADASVKVLIEPGSSS
jgi:(R,R)-butanediol dehydrogenase/meso-butanediol dehydrogenase/diacetyl reductase